MSAQYCWILWPIAPYPGHENWSRSAWLLAFPAMCSIQMVIINREKQRLVILNASIHRERLSGCIATILSVTGFGWRKFSLTTNKPWYRALLWVGGHSRNPLTGFQRCSRTNCRTGSVSSLRAGFPCCDDSPRKDHEGEK